MNPVIRLLLVMLVVPLSAVGQEVDLSSPKSAAKGLYQAVLRGDAAALRQVIYVAKPEQAPLAAAIADLLVAGKELGDAGKARFGESAERLGAGTVIADDLVQIEQASVRESEGIATLTIANQLVPLQFKKDQQGWKLLIDDFFAVHEETDKQTALLNELSAALRKVAGELTAGRYPTADDVETAIQQHFNDVMIKAAKSTTQPATQPK